MNIFISGNRGFIGKHLVKFLSGKGYHILTTDVDLSREVPSFSKLDCIIHLAWKVPQKAMDINPEEIDNENLLIVNNILQVVKIHQAKLIFASTSAIYGNQEASLVCENAFPIPINNYGVTKLKAEKMILNFCADKAIILRIFNAYGSEQNPNFLIPYLVSAFLKGEPVNLKTPASKRDFIHVKDICSAFYKAVIHLNSDTKHTSSIYNIGNGKAYSILNSAQTIKALTKSKSKIISNKNTTSSIQALKADISKAEKQLSWKPKVSLDQGLEETIVYYQSIL